MLAFLDNLDIANRALQHLGQPRIASTDEDSKANDAMSFAYDKLRRAELQRAVWTFATRKVVLRAIDEDTMLLDPREYDADVTYLPGAIVKDANGSIWQSVVGDNLDNEPGQSSAWEAYFGPMSVHLHDTTITYQTGELVYKAGSNPGGYVVYMSLQNENDDVPSTGDAYDATVTYKMNDIVTYGGYVWRSLIEFNLGTTPADPPLPWYQEVVYSAAQTVLGTDGYIYSSVSGSNQGFNPVTDAGVHWTNTGVPAAWDRDPTQHESAKSWRPIAAAIRTLLIQYPVGAGPVSQASTRNAFRLPSGYIRQAPAAPKAGTGSWFPAALLPDDADLEGDLLISPDAGPLVLRFVADITDVTKMHDLFCEGLACRLAYETCEEITQSSSKQAAVGAAYNRFMGEARTINAIERGPVEPTEDDYISCRA